MKKRMLAMLLLALMVLQVFAPTVFAVADDEMRFQIARDVEGQPGEIVEVRVEVSQNVAAGWLNMNYMLSFDPAVLELLDWEHPFMPTMPREPFAGNHTPIWAGTLGFDETGVPAAWIRDATLVNHGVYRGDGVFEHGMGHWRPTDPTVGLNFVTVGFVPNRTIIATGRTDTFFSVFRFRINETAVPGTTTGLSWEFIGGARGSDVPGLPGLPVIPRVPTALPHEQGLVTVVDYIPYVRLFPDVPDGHWGRHFVLEAHRRGFMNGYPNGMFVPYGNLTRAQVAVIVLNMSGVGTQPFPPTNPFPDVPANAWYAPAIAWASHPNQRIMNGHADGTFTPGALVTREQFALIMHNLARWQGHDVTSPPQGGPQWPFSDEHLISWWAVDAVRWANYHRIILGDASGFRPNDVPLRVEAATMTVRYDNEFPR
ncbi:MAG: S-layer homology domain-containing protein [Oscillospiraceae bacterium]|nr:S-layer homology domain-containing protein [Oscillospiraceae bacterium]